MKIKELLKSITNNKYRYALLRGLALIGLITAISTISVHYLTGDTLSEYAKNNPDIAYPSVEAIDEGDTADGAVSGDNNVSEDNGASEGNVTPDEDSNPVADNSSESGEESENDTTSEVNENSGEDVNSTADSDTSDSAAPAGQALSSVNISPMIHFYNPTTTADGLLTSEADSNKPNRVNHENGFYYEPLTDEMVSYITGTSYPTSDANPQVSLSELRYVGILYNDFNGITQAGELICNAYIAGDLVEIFSELYKSEYQFDKIVLIDNYGGDDTASMCADNTSCFNYRVVEGKTTLSKHAYGLAIDINPFYNPYLVFGGNDDGSDYISPSGSEVYIDRSKNFAYKIDENDLCYKLFTAHGFTWGGNWNSCKDYQHFQKTK